MIPLPVLLFPRCHLFPFFDSDFVIEGNVFTAYLSAPDFLSKRNWDTYVLIESKIEYHISHFPFKVWFFMTFFCY